MRGLIVAGLVSGVTWGLIALGLGHKAIGRTIWGGVIAAPLIGLLISLTLGRLDPPARGVRVLVALVALYVAACLFGIAMGVFDLVRFAQSGHGWYRTPLQVLLESVLGVLWGLTVSGYFLFLGPLAYANLRLLRRLV